MDIGYSHVQDDRFWECWIKFIDSCGLFRGLCLRKRLRVTVATNASYIATTWTQKLCWRSTAISTHSNLSTTGWITNTQPLNSSHTENSRSHYLETCIYDTTHSIQLKNWRSKCVRWTQQDSKSDRCTALGYVEQIWSECMTDFGCSPEIRKPSDHQLFRPSNAN